MAEVITVSALNRYVKSLFDANDRLFDLALRGEVANFVQNARSGHCYFTLRDEQASVKAVMFRSDAQRLAFCPEEGMRVVVRCRATLYERDGAFQLYVNEMFPDGIGAAQLALEQLKARLEQEGLFDAAHKKPLPQYPRCIGLVTSKTGAALQDIRNVISRRWPGIRLLLCPVMVQGFEAAPQIAAAIRTLDRSGRADVIIVARGGGSREDLWVFNAEVIARAAFACKTPLISAIGHEIDYTILDFVADQRAPTPSAAAELAVPDREEQWNILQNLQQNISENMQKRLKLCYNELEQYNLALERKPAHHIWKRDFDQLEQAGQTLQIQIQRRMQAANMQLEHAAALTASLSPYQVLARGYAMITTGRGQILPADQLEPDKTIYIRSAESSGRLRITAQHITDTEHQHGPDAFSAAQQAVPRRTAYLRFLREKLCTGVFQRGRSLRQIHLILCFVIHQFSSRCSCMVCVIFASISSIWSDVFSSAVWQYSIRDAASAYNLTASARVVCSSCILARMAFRRSMPSS